LFYWRFDPGETTIVSGDYLPQAVQEQLEPQLQVEAPEHPQLAIVVIVWVGWWVVGCKSKGARCGVLL
jgi:hypothetical protein